MKRRTSLTAKACQLGEQAASINGGSVSKQLTFAPGGAKGLTNHLNINHKMYECNTQRWLLTGSK